MRRNLLAYVLIAALAAMFVVALFGGQAGATHPSPSPSPSSSPPPSPSPSPSPTTHPRPECNVPIAITFPTSHVGRLRPVQVIAEVGTTCGGVRSVAFFAGLGGHKPIGVDAIPSGREFSVVWTPHGTGLRVLRVTTATAFGEGTDFEVVRVRAALIITRF